MKRLTQIDKVKSGLVFLSYLCLMGLGIACSEENILGVHLWDLELVNFESGYQYEKVTFDDGVEMPYVMHSPIVTSASRLPLIIVLHGSIPQGTYKGEIFLKYLAVPGLLEINAIFVAPTIKSPHWTSQKALDQIKALIRGAIKADWPIDPTKVVVLGYSNGGMGVWYMTGQEPELFAAGISIAAEPVTGSLKGTNIVPKYAIHSRNDEVFPFANVQLKLQDAIDHGAPIVLAPADNLSHSSVDGYAPLLREAQPWLLQILN